MLKVAYYAFAVAGIATPVHFMAGNAATRAIVLALVALAAVVTVIGLLRNP